MTAVVNIVDLGIEFVGWAGIVKGEDTCFIPDRVTTDPDALDIVARTMPLSGAWCLTTCTNARCPLWGVAITA